VATGCRRSSGRSFLSDAVQVRALACVQNSGGPTHGVRQVPVGGVGGGQHRLVGFSRNRARPVPGLLRPDQRRCWPYQIAGPRQIPIGGACQLLPRQKLRPIPSAAVRTAGASREASMLWVLPATDTAATAASNTGAATHAMPTVDSFAILDEPATSQLTNIFASGQIV
jgi:hypothetical protein